MSDPKFVITEKDWDKMSPTLQAKTTYRTVISLREDVIDLLKKVDNLINQPTVCPYEKRIEHLEKWKVIKNIGSIFGGFLGGLGGSHLPK